MSTRSYIGIQNPDGTVRAIYHHWDGYVEGVGKVLYNHYQNVDKINKLIDLGDMSMIGTEPVGYWGEDKNLGDDDPTKCKTYRERGEEGVDAMVYDDEEDYLFNADEDYTYLYKDGEWYVRNWDSPLEKLEDILSGATEFKDPEN